MLGDEYSSNIGVFELVVIALMGVFFLMFVVTTVVAVMRIRRTRQAFREQGIDPEVAQARWMGRLASSPATLEQRLAELDDMCLRGTITAEERASARARLLGGG